MTHIPALEKSAIRALLIYFLVCFFLFSCANIKQIEGGPIDKKPPTLVPQKSTSQGILNFKEKKIEFTFDEWVSLNNPNQNILISPRPKKIPNYKLKGKTFQIEFDKNEELLPNTTYSIFLGESIQDITNKNTANNLNFVFSTGATIDSLSVTGKAVDALTLKPVIRAQISLYSNLTDTAFLTEAPLYLALTDSSGSFRINHIKPGEYNIYGLLDKNQNYYFDQKTESIAFFQNMISLENQNQKNILLKFSQERTPNYIKEKKFGDGILKLHFAAKPDQLKIDCMDCMDTHILTNGDSTKFWYTLDRKSSCYVNYDGKLDTFPLNISGEQKSQVYLKINQYAKQIVKGRTWEIIWFEPIRHIDTSKIRFSCSEVFSVRIDSLDHRKAVFNIPTRDGDNFQVILDSNAIHGIHNSFSVRDTLKSTIIAISSLSSLTVTLDTLIPDASYLFQILQDDKLIEETIFNASGYSIKLSYQALTPGKYKARLILDNNRNGHWDPGKFAGKIQPEEIWNWDIKELRADWDMEVNFKL